MKKLLNLHNLKNVNLSLLVLLFGIVTIVLFNIFDRIAYKKNVYEELIYLAPKYIEEQSNILIDYTQRSKDIILSISRSENLDIYLLSSEKKALNMLMKNLLYAEKDLMQLRFIDEKGKERIRFDRQSLGGTIVEITGSHLQDKSSRDYVQKNINQPSRIWFSSLDLNIEHGKIEVPFKPTYRVVFPVWYQEKFRGMIVMNYFASVMLSKLFNHTAYYHPELLDEDRYIVYSPYENERWSRFQNPAFKVENASSLAHREIKTPFSNKLYVNLRVNQDMIDRKYLQERNHIQDISIYMFIVVVVIALFLNYALKSSRVKQDQYLQNLMNTSLVAYYVYSFKENTNLFINQRYTDILGYTLEELQEMDGDSFIERFHPDEIENIIAHMQKVASSNPGEAFEIQYRFKHKDGFWVWCYSRDTLIEKDKNGNPTKMLGSFNDMTEQMEFQHNLEASVHEKTSELKKQKYLFESTFEQAAVGIAHVSPEGKWLKVNQKLCDILEYTKEELYQLSFQDITHLDDLEIDMAYVQQMLDKEIDNYSMQKRYIKKDSTIIWINLTVSLVWNENGEPDYFISVIEDISSQKQLQKELQIKFLEEERKNKILDKHVITSTTDLRGVITNVSEAFCEISGFSKEELVGKQHNIVRHPDMPTSLYEELWRTIENNETWHGKIKNLRKDGNIYWVDASIEPLYDEDGKKIGYSAIRHDITEEMLKIEKEQELIKVHENLAEVLDRYQQALVVTEDGIWDWDVTTMQVYYSPMWKHLLGYEEDEIENEFSEWERLVHPDDLEESRREALKLANGEILHYDIEFRMLCKDGHYKWIRSKAKTIRKDENGKPKRIVGIHVDMQNQKDLLKGVLDSSASGIMAFTAIKDESQNIIDFKWILVNKEAEKITGKKANELLGEQLLLKMPGNKEDGLFDIYVDVTTSRKEVQREFFYEHEGLKHWFYQIIVPYKDGFVVTFSDITKNKLLEEANKKKEKLLIQQSKMAAMGEMIANIAHQWKQPLSMLSLSILAVKKKYDKEKLDDNYMLNFVENSQNFIQKMNATISDFSNYFSPSKENKEFDLYESIYQVREFFEPMLKKNSIVLKIKQDNESQKAIVVGAKNELEQVLLNIVKNAIDAIVGNEISDGNIEISVEENDKQWIVELHDNGGGIPNDVIDRVFEPYFTTKFKSDGTGIGLYMSKMIIEESFDGFISVTSDPIGTTFKITLPKNNL